MAGKTRVAVLGGGVGALSAAYALTEVDPKGERFEITLYQLGWRLGGKTASGRNADHGERIEEHGLHIWAGFYENAFTVLRSALRALGRPPGSPQATLEQTFLPQDLIFLTERYKGEWLPWPLWFQPDSGSAAYPGRDDLLSPAPPVAPPLATLINRALWAFLYNDAFYASHMQHDPAAEAAARIAAMPLVLKAKAEAIQLLGTALPLLSSAERLAAEIAADCLNRSHATEAALIALLSAQHDLIKAELKLGGGITELRRYLLMLDLGLRVIMGMLMNGCLEHGLHVLDRFEFREFLAQTGPLDEATDGALVASLYDYTFAYENGDTPRLSACSAVQGLMRMFMTYKGAFFFKSTAGMGDTICTPIYEVLKRRGVTFKFFHQVTGIEPTPDGFDVGAITLNRQVDLAPGVLDYDPLRMVEGLPCWPSTPRWEQLLNGAELAAEGVDFEDVLAPLPPPAAQLRLEVGRDFDRVVLGIPVGALRTLCKPLADVNVAWADMLANLKTTRTQAFQLWLDRDVETLGGTYVEPTVPPSAWAPIMPPPPGLGPATTAAMAAVTAASPPAPLAPQMMGPIVTGFAKPFDTYSDMSQLLPAEAWPASSIGPKSIAYFCTTMGDDEAPDEQEAANAKVKQNALAWMTASLPTLWTGINQGGGFDWEALHAAGQIAGPARFDAQFWQANITPGERYVLSLPGTLQHRMEPGRSGFDNLYLAGDWTKVPDINAGCVEVAAMSGLMAASALSGVDIPIAATDTLYTRTQFANFGGWTTLPPPPSVCKDATVYAWGLKSKGHALQRYLDQSLNKAAGRRRFRPLVDRVFLTIVSSGELSPGPPPFSSEGLMAETDIGFWFLAGCYDMGDVLPSAIGWVPAYLLVDNGYAAASGREIWGFPKYPAWTSVPGTPPSRGPFEASALVIPAFAPGAAASRQPVIRAEGSDGGFRPHFGAAIDGLIHLCAHVGELALEAEDLLKRAHLLPTAGLPAPVFFLKQFRSADSATDACFQQILKGALVLDEIKAAGLLTGSWRLEFSYSDSLPFIRDLGLGAPTEGKLVIDVETGFWAKVDFTVGKASPFT